MFMLLSGHRPDVVRKARVAHADFRKRVLRIPSQSTAPGVPLGETVPPTWDQTCVSFQRIHLMNRTITFSAMIMTMTTIINVTTPCSMRSKRGASVQAGECA